MQQLKEHLIKNFLDKKAGTQANTDAIEAFLQGEVQWYHLNFGSYYRNGKKRTFNGTML